LESIDTAIVLLQYNLASKNYFIELIRIALLFLCPALKVPIKQGTREEF